MEISLRCIYEKWQQRQGCTLRLEKVSLLPMGRDRKIRTALTTSQIVGFVTCPLRKKKKQIQTFNSAIQDNAA